MHNNLPNFVIIGAPKSGTTSIFYYLKQHPEVYLPVRKELHYFSYADLETQVAGPGDRDVLNNLCSDWETYRRHYNAVDGQKAIGEVSPSYLYFSHVAEKIKKELGDVKIVAVLRNPIKKAFSQYSHLKRDCREVLSFYEALHAERVRAHQGWGDFWRYTESSLYTDRLMYYFHVFGREKVKVYLFDDFVLDSEGLMKDLFSFLGVDHSFKVGTEEIYNRSGRYRSRFVSHFFSRPNLVKNLAKAIIPEWIRLPIRLKVLDMNTASKEAIDDRSRDYLVKAFSKDIEQLESLIGRKTGWLSRNATI